MFILYNNVLYACTCKYEISHAHMQDFKKTKDLLKKENIEKITLESFAIQAATVCSGLDANEVECAVNHHGDKDIALFDFTTMHSSENASRIIERKGKRLLLCVAGDTLLQV